MTAARWLLTLAFLSVVTLTAMLLRGRSATPPAEPLASPDLQPWQLIGCYELAVDPWEAERMIPLTTSEPPSEPPPDTVPDTVPLTDFRFPSAIMLQPDSLDEWGRSLGAYRVVTLTPEEVVGGPLRWYTRADTLWILGSATDTRAGIALFDMRDSLVGQARLVTRTASQSATAPATVWPINCATRARVSTAGRPRR